MLYISCIDFIKRQFAEKNTSRHKEIYPHVTCATDRNNVEKVFEDVQDTVVTTSLEVGGLV